jgi:CheY-like chemotaxis protein
VTADMAFECVLVSRDPGVVCVMNKILDKLSIYTKVCFTSSKAAERLAEGSTDLIIVDWEDNTADFLRAIREPERRQKPTVIAVSALAQPAPGAHFTLRKPMTGESCSQSLKIAYSRMLRDHRHHARYSVMNPVTAQDQNKRSVAVTIMDIGDGGVGLATRELLAVGDTLSFRLSLPDTTRPIYIEARVLWTRKYGAVGCEFLRIPPVDLDILHTWLKLKCKVKQPLMSL